MAVGRIVASAGLRHASVAMKQLAASQGILGYWAVSTGHVGRLTPLKRYRETWWFSLCRLTCVPSTGATRGGAARPRRAQTMAASDELCTYGFRRPVGPGWPGAETGYAAVLIADLQRTRVVDAAQPAWYERAALPLLSSQSSALVVSGHLRPLKRRWHRTWRKEPWTSPH